MPARGRRGRCLMRSCIAIVISDVICVGPAMPDLPHESRSINSSFSHASPAQCIRFAAMPVPLIALFIQPCESLLRVHCCLAHECAPRGVPAAHTYAPNCSHSITFSLLVLRLQFGA